MAGFSYTQLHQVFSQYIYKLNFSRPPLLRHNLNHTPVTIHNPGRVDTWRDQGTAGSDKWRAALHLPGQGRIDFPDGIIQAPYAEMVRAGQVDAIELFLA